MPISIRVYYFERPTQLRRISASPLEGTVLEQYWCEYIANEESMQGYSHNTSWEVSMPIPKSVAEECKWIDN